MYGPPLVVDLYNSNPVSLIAGAGLFCQVILFDLSDRGTAARLVAASGFGVAVVEGTTKFGEKSVEHPNCSEYLARYVPAGALNESTLLSSVRSVERYHW